MNLTLSVMRKRENQGDFEIMSTICTLNDRMDLPSEGQRGKEGTRNRKYGQCPHLTQKCWHLARRVPWGLGPPPSHPPRRLAGERTRLGLP